MSRICLLVSGVELHHTRQLQSETQSTNYDSKKVAFAIIVYAATTIAGFEKFLLGEVVWRRNFGSARVESPSM